MIEAKELKLQNYNNCLACEGFIQIHFAPDRYIHETELSKLLHVKHGNEDIYVKVVDLMRIDFKDVTTTMTLPATGMESEEWREWWMKQYPETKSDSKMAVYYYKKAKV